MTQISQSSSRESIARRLAEGRRRAVPKQVAIAPDPSARFEPFPLADMQHAYWVGRDSRLDSAGAIQFYLEFQTVDFDRDRFERAWNALVARHDMLRAVVMEDGRQRVLETAPFQRVEIQDLSDLAAEEQEKRVQASRARLQSEIADIARWPQSTFVFSRLGAEKVGRLHMKFDIWCTDGRSLQIIFEELATLYLRPSAELPAITLSFRDYVLALRAYEQGEEWRRSLEWWRGRLADRPPPPPLPTRRAPGGGAPLFVRHDDSLDASETEALRNAAAHNGLSLPVAMLAAYAEALGRWSGARRFTINVPRFNRLDWHPDIDRVVGEFASFNLLAIDLDQGATFLDRARAIQRRLWADLEHQTVSGIRQLREYARLHGGIEAGAMPIVFTTMPESRPGESGRLTDALAPFGEIVDAVSRTPQVWVDCQYFENAGRFVFNWDVIDAMFPEGVVESAFTAFAGLVKGLARDPAVWTQAEPISLPQAQIRARESANATARPIVERAPIEEILERETRAPSASAVIEANGETLSYHVLLSRARRLAEEMERAGVSPRGVVALLLRKGWRQPAGVLAAHLLGCAYLPIDPANPDERIARILAAACPDLLMTDDPARSHLHERVLAIGGAILDGEAESFVFSPPRLDDAACVIFTSGSTGAPKGVALTHRGLANSLQFSAERFALAPQDRVIAVTGLHHDLSLFDLLGTLSTGGAVVIPDARREIDPDHWLDLVADAGVTIWNSVPRFMELLVAAAESRGEGLPKSLRQVMLGGDWIPVDLPARLRAVRPDIRVTSVGGPTETTIWNIMHEATEPRPADCPSILYGRPIANTTYHIFDEALRDCPDFVPGEMHCGGLGVAIGYVNDDDATAARFVMHPRSGERLYRTGDRGCYRPDGTIEFLGRVDFQLNFGGHRADPLEIEQAIAEHAAVKDAIVVTHSATGTPLLVAFYRAAADVDGETLRAWTARRVPPSLVPRVFQPLPRFPLSANGKVDRAALAAAPLEARAGDDEAPQTPLEQHVATIWSETLGRPVTRAGDNFFELGGDSLNATQILLRIEADIGVRPPLALVFTNATVRSFSAAVIRLIAEENGIENAA